MSDEVAFEHIVIGFFVTHPDRPSADLQAGSCQYGAEGDMQRLPGVELLQQAGEVGVG